MQSTNKAGYKNKISSYFIQSFEKDEEDSKYDPANFNVDLEEFEIRKYVVALQAAWRSRTARIMVCMCMLYVYIYSFQTLWTHKQQ
jgi:hypothetical protein